MRAWQCAVRFPPRRLLRRTSSRPACTGDWREKTTCWTARGGGAPFYFERLEGQIKEGGRAEGAGEKSQKTHSHSLYCEPTTDPPFKFSLKVSKVLCNSVLYCNCMRVWCYLLGWVRVSFGVRVTPLLRGRGEPPAFAQTKRIRTRRNRVQALYCHGRRRRIAQGGKLSCFLSFLVVFGFDVLCFVFCLLFPSFSRGLLVGKATFSE